MKNFAAVVVKFSAAVYFGFISLLLLALAFLIIGS